MILSFASNISTSIVNKDVKLASLSLNSDQHQFLPYNISALLREKGVRINNDHPRKKVLIFYQIL